MSFIYFKFTYGSLHLAIPMNVLHKTAFLFPSRRRNLPERHLRSRSIGPFDSCLIHVSRRSGQKKRRNYLADMGTEHVHRLAYANDTLMKNAPLSCLVGGLSTEESEFCTRSTKGESLAQTRHHNRNSWCMLGG